MKSASWTLLFAAQAFAAIPISSVKKETNLPIVPNKFIIEVDNVSSFTNKRDGLTVHEALYASLKARDITFDVEKEYNDAGLFVGASVILTNPDDALQITNTDGVKAIRPVRKFARPQPVKSHIATGLDDPELPVDSQSTHVLTGVDKLHAEGIKGKGIKIGVIDTGVDYTHPNLKGNYAGGYDFVGDDYTGDNTPVPDDDPLDQCAGHGTHVAGIIGASPDNEYNMSGVAYEASIAAYRVFGCDGVVQDDVIIDALLRGVRDGQDILTLSLGGPDGWSESSSSVVASRIAESGKIVTIAAGNEGSSGSWYSSSPSNGINVISVASLDNTEFLLQSAIVGGVEHDPILYFDLVPFPFAEPLPIYAISNDTTVADDACSPLGDDVPDLSSYLVIVRRGTCTFVQKLQNIAAKGAQIAFIYDNGNGFNAISVGEFNATLIQAADGQFLVEQFAAGVPVTITFPQTGGAVTFPNPSGGLISSFTTYGPSNDFFFKPAIAAPGGSILSTLPTTQGSFGIDSGTSMATPFLAGVAALLLEVKGKSHEVAIGARTLFQSTAKTVPSSHTDGDPLQTVAQQGAGLVNAYDAIHTTTLVYPAELILNDTAHFKKDTSFTVVNTGSEAKEYRLTHVPAGTALTVQENSILPELGPVPLTADAATVSFNKNRFRLRPGQSQTVRVRIKPPTGLDASRLPLYSGFVHVTSGSEDLHVSYVGLAASLKDKQVVDNSDYFFGVPTPAVLDSAGEVQIDATNYTFTDTDYPTLLWRLAFGTPLLRVDLVDAAIDFKATLNTRQEAKVTSSFTFPHKHDGGSFARVKIIGTLLELNYIPRNDEGDNGYTTFSLPEPTFANGTTIAEGTYRVLIRSLKVTGDPKKEEDYESWLSPIVGVN